MSERKREMESERETERGRQRESGGGETEVERGRLYAFSCVEWSPHIKMGSGRLAVSCRIGIFDGMPNMLNQLEEQGVWSFGVRTRSEVLQG